MEIILIVALILLNGVFSMSEIALISSRKFKLENAAKKGNNKAKKALDLANNPNKFLSTVQIGITLIGILTGIFSGEQLTTDLEDLISNIEPLRPFAHSLAVLLIVIIITFFSIVFGELIPKRIGLLFPERIAAAVATPMNFISVLASPFIWLLGKTNEVVLRLLGLSSKADNRVTEEEIKAIIQDSTEGGEIQAIEQDIVERVFALGDRRISELMTHRSDLIWFDTSDSLETVREKVKNENHSIYPVANGHLDNIAGIISIRELFPLDLSTATFNLTSFIKKPLVVHTNTPAYKVLEKFKEYRQHYAIVVDEYGAVQGIVSMDDILDALLGDVSELHQLEYQITQRSENSWLADGQYPFFEFLNYFDIPDLENGKNGDFNTIAGLVLHELGRVPLVGEKILWKQMEIEVADMDGMRIDKVIINALPQ